MFRDSLPENAGMLFVYEREDGYAMWMKNTYVPLSVAFIDRRGVILNIEDMEPQTLDSHASAGPAKYALEMNRVGSRNAGSRRATRCWAWTSSRRPLKAKAMDPAVRPTGAEFRDDLRAAPVRTLPPKCCAA